MLCLPGFGTHANTQNLPHFRAFPASIQEHSPAKCLFFMANAELPNRPGFALLQWHPPVRKYHSHQCETLRASLVICYRSFPRVCVSQV